MVERLRYLRKRAGLTQQQLGEACGLGGSWVRRIESGTSSLKNITLEKAVALSRALGITERELLAIGEVAELYENDPADTETTPKHFKK